MPSTSIRRAASTQTSGWRTIEMPCCFTPLSTRGSHTACCLGSSAFTCSYRAQHQQTCFAPPQFMACFAKACAIRRDHSASALHLVRHECEGWQEGRAGACRLPPLRKRELRVGRVRGCGRAAQGVEGQEARVQVAAQRRNLIQRVQRVPAAARPSVHGLAAKFQANICACLRLPCAWPTWHYCHALQAPAPDTPHAADHPRNGWA